MALTSTCAKLSKIINSKNESHFFFLLKKWDISISGLGFLSVTWKIIKLLYCKKSAFHLNILKYNFVDYSSAGKYDEISDYMQKDFYAEEKVKVFKY